MIQGVVTEEEIRLSKANFVEIYSIKILLHAGVGNWVKKDVVKQLDSMETWYFSFLLQNFSHLCEGYAGELVFLMGCR